jgi:hypothetical protein
VGHTKYLGAVALALLILGGCAGKSITVQIPHSARCYLKSDEEQQRQIVMCVCDDECWDQTR